jgi:hypothetical protein
MERSADMFEQFDDLKNNENNRKAAHANAPTQFENLKKSMSQIQGKPYKDQFFDWKAPDGGDALLTLATVAAQFMVRKDRYFIEFGGLPSYEQAADRPQPERWELTPDSYEGNFVWMTGTKRNLPDQLAEDVAARVAEFYNAYEEVAGL